MGRTGFVVGIALAVVMVTAGYRMGTVEGLAVMAGGGLVAWYVVHATTWSIPTIADVQDRPREDGLGVPRDLRSFDPDVVQDQRFWASLDSARPDGNPDDPGGRPPAGGPRTR